MTTTAGATAIGTERTPAALMQLTSAPLPISDRSGCPQRGFSSAPDDAGRRTGGTHSAAGPTSSGDAMCLEPTDEGAALALHDLCNALTIVRGYAELLADDAAADNGLRPRLVALREAAAHATTLARGMVESAASSGQGSEILELRSLSTR